MKRRRSSYERSLESMVQDIHEKLEGIGFEGLVKNVESIEKTQLEMLRRMEDIHTVIYEPDQGLFARVKRAETNHREELQPLRSDVNKLNEWQAELTKKDGPIASIERNTREVEALVGVKRKLSAYMITAIGSMLLVVAKAVWDFVRDHVAFR